MEKDMVQVHLSYDEINNLDIQSTFTGTPKLIIGYLSPDIDFKEAAAKLKRLIPESVLILTSTAGELCSYGNNTPSPLYIAADENRKSVVLQEISDRVIEKIDVHTIELFDAEMEAEKRTELIRKEFLKLNHSFNIDHKHCVAYTLIDGLSRSESF